MHKKYNPHQLKQKGLTPIEQLKIKEMVRKREQEMVNEVFFRLMVIPTMQLAEEEWSKSPRAKFIRYISKMMILNEQLEDEYSLKDADAYCNEKFGCSFGFMLNEAHKLAFGKEIEIKEK